MPPGTLNQTEPLNRNWGPNQGLGLCLLSMPDGQKGATWRDIAAKNTATFGATTTAPTWSNKVRVGGFGCLNFDSGDDTIDLGSKSYLTDSVPFGIAWWENILTSAIAYQPRFRLQVGAGGSGNSYGVLRSSDAAYAWMTFNKWNGTSNCPKASGLSTIANSVGVWKHIAIVGLVGPNNSTASNFLVYENGQSVTVANGASNPFSNFASANKIGYDGLNNGANCIMDDVRIWPSRAPSSGEIAAVWRDGIARYPNSLNWIQSRMVAPAVAGFKPYWVRRSSQVIGGGSR